MVQRKMDQIRSSPEWFRAIEQKAADKGIPVDSALYWDALYVVQEEGP
jgi:hypothetical protein